jgi:hypothetical protein
VTPPRVSASGLTAPRSGLEVPIRTGPPGDWNQGHGPMTDEQAEMTPDDQADGASSEAELNQPPREPSSMRIDSGNFSTASAR